MPQESSLTEWHRTKFHVRSRHCETIDHIIMRDLISKASTLDGLEGN
jgi:hypothetical protein